MKKYIGKCLLIEEKGKRILVIGDLHLGYEEMMNRAGVFISRKMYQEMIDDLNKIFENAGKIDIIVLLGDVKHDFGGLMKQEWNDVLQLCDYLRDKIGKKGKIVITRGNHDNFLKTVAWKFKDKKIEIVDYFVMGKYCFLHGDKIYDIVKNKNVGIVVLGHGHPALTLIDKTKSEKYKCFLEGKWKGKRVIIAPSFIEYSEGSDPREGNFMMNWKFNFNEFRARVINGFWKAEEVEEQLFLIFWLKLRYWNM